MHRQCAQECMYLYIETNHHLSGGVDFFLHSVDPLDTILQPSYYITFRKEHWCNNFTYIKWFSYKKNIEKVQKIHQIPFITKHKCKKTNSKINVCMYYFANILNGVGVGPRGAMNFFFQKHCSKLWGNSAITECTFEIKLFSNFRAL